MSNVTEYDQVLPEVRVRSIWSTFGWDGILPILVACTPAIIRRVLPQGHIGEVVSVILTPIAFALIRAHVGLGQLWFAFGSEPPWSRQLTLGAAIILLLLFELYSTMLQFADDAPAIAWLPAIGLFIAYLVTIIVALRPKPPFQNGR